MPLASQLYVNVLVFLSFIFQYQCISSCDIFVVVTDIFLYHILALFDVVSVVDFRVLRCVVASHCFNFNYLMTQNVELFHMFIFHLCTFFDEESAQVFCSVFDQVVHFLTVEFEEFFFILDTRHLSDVSFEIFVSHCVACLLIL